MTELHIRRADASDASAIAGLLDQLGYPSSKSEVPARLERFERDRRAAILLAERDGRVIGLATVHVITVLNRARDVAWLTALVVDESARGAGVGRGLVRAVEAFALAAGCERLSVTTHEDRKLAQAFYPRVGLDATGRRFGKMLAP